MRKVKFKKWIPAIETPEYIEYKKEHRCGFKGRTNVEGTGCWSDFIYEGIFHQWANACTESNDGFGNYTVALIEIADGTIEQINPEHLKFINDDD
jgi:hypothetical protein